MKFGALISKFNFSKMLQVKLISEKAIVPKRGSERAAGYDLYSSEDTLVPARGRKLIKTGVSIAVPAGNYARVAPRSGLALKNFIDVGAGVVDEDYRGEGIYFIKQYSWCFAL